MKGIKEPKLSGFTNSVKEGDYKPDKSRSFRDVVAQPQVENDNVNALPLKPIPTPRIEGGNVVVVVDDEEYKK